jgi:hypothetical protein
MMKKILMVLAVFSLSAPAFAAQNPHILYMAVNSGGDLLGLDDPVFRRVFDHTGNYLHHRHFRLFEEGGQQSQHGYSRSQALKIVSQTGPDKVDHAVLVSIKHIQEKKGQRLNDRMVALAAIVDVRTLDVVDTIRVKSPTARLDDRRCSPACQDLIMRRHVREVLPQFKDRLANRLTKIAHKQADVNGTVRKLTLTLKGFKPREVRHIENQLVQLNTTADLSALASKPNKPVFWLERRKNAGDVRTDLSQVLEKLDLKARIIQTRNHVILEKVAQNLAYLD